MGGGLAPTHHPFGPPQLKDPLMLSNKVKSVPVDQILIDRDTRQRRDIDTSDIIESIRRRGVLVPICITQSNRLIFGERRLTAAREAGHQTILARIAPDTLTEADLQILELEENLMRKDLPWQDKAHAMHKLWTLHKAAHPTHTTTQFSETVGYSRVLVDKLIAASREITSGNERVAQAPTYQRAVNVIQRQRQRENNTILADILDNIGNAHQPELEREAAVASPPSLIQTCFHEWAQTYTGPKFNVIHCDFPYGIDLHDSDQLQNNGTAHQTYDDGEEVFWELLATLADYQDTILSTSAHMIFWYSMKFHDRLADATRRLLPTWTFDEYPLVWLKSDSRGIAPDVTRRPRRVYETALFGWRGDRRTLRLVNNAYAAPKEASAHPSTKPEPMLRHFLSAIIDPNTRLLDPTCGSGSAIRAAESLGAEYALGLERDPEFLADAQAKLRAFRATQQLSEAIA